MKMKIMALVPAVLAGGFRCTSDVGQGPLTGCLAGQGVRWDTAGQGAGCAPAIAHFSS